jgi:hypothetical protein
MEKGITHVNPRLEKLKEDDEFIKNVTASTSDQTAVTKRFEKASKYLLSD